jgi:hypothetical protein
MPLNSTHYPELQPFSLFSYFFFFSYFLMLGVNKILVDFNYFKKYDKILVIVSKRKPTRPNCINIIIFSGTTKEVINDRNDWFGLAYGVYRHFQNYVSYIIAVSFIGGGNHSTRRNHRPVASQ